jgi:predicted DNA-binding transcriptional regulator YafY
LIVASTQHRQMIILQYIPRYPKKICTRELLEKVSTQGIEASIRTIQRDLERLSGMGLFGIGADTSSKPIGWYLMKDSPEPDMSVMDINTAIAFELMRISVEDLLPKSTRNHIEPYFGIARQLLSNRNNWHKKIAYTQKLPSRLPDINESDRDLLFEAIDTEMCISASIGQVNENELVYKFADVIHPLGLMVNEQRTYLVFTLYGRKKLFSAPLHRIKDVKILSQKISPPENFNLDYYVNSDPLNRCYERAVNLELEVSNALANYLHENPLGADQAIETMERNKYRVSVIVDDTNQLRTTLRGFGKDVVIRKPDKIRFQLS